jgi:hypothetical protein
MLSTSLRVTKSILLLAFLTKALTRARNFFYLRKCGAGAGIVSKFSLTVPFSSPHFPVAGFLKAGIVGRYAQRQSTSRKF